MKTFLVVLTTLALAAASVIQISPTIYSADFPLTTQYNSFGGSPTAQTEYILSDGLTRGSYSYVDADGKVQTIDYTSDSAKGLQSSSIRPTNDVKVALNAGKGTPAKLGEAKPRAQEDTPNTDVNGDEGQDNGSQEQQVTKSKSAESGSTSGSDNSTERNTQESEMKSTKENRNNKENSNNNGETNTNGIARNGISSDLGLNGIGSSFSKSLAALNLNGEFNNALNEGLKHALGSLQLNDDIPAGLSDRNDVFRLSKIIPAKSELRPISLFPLQLSATSYLPVSTPSIVSPKVVTAVPTNSKSIQTISRQLQIPLSSTFLSQKLL